MSSPKNVTDGLLISISKNCETLIKQTHTKPQEALEFKLTKPLETSSFQPPIILGVDSNWMIEFTSLEI